MQIHEDGRPILRFSLFEKWWQNPQQAMQDYFPEDKEGISTKYMAFGSMVADGLCERPIPWWLEGVKHYDINEHRIITDMDGFLIRGTLDSFDTKRFKYLDNKCCKVKRLKNGNWSAHSWTENKVKKHKQLVFYSVLVQEKYGQVDEECHISVIPIYEDINGLVRRTGDASIEIPRIITQTERNEMREKIVATAGKITKMFEEYKKGYLTI